MSVKALISCESLYGALFVECELTLKNIYELL